MVPVGDGDNVTTIYDRGGGCGPVEARPTIGICEFINFRRARIGDGAHLMAHSGRLARIPSAGFIGRFLCGFACAAGKNRESWASVTPTIPQKIFPYQLVVTTTSFVIGLYGGMIFVVTVAVVMITAGAVIKVTVANKTAIIDFMIFGSNVFFNCYRKHVIKKFKICE